MHKKYHNLFNNKVSNFVNSDVLEQQTVHDFHQQIANVRHSDPFRSAKINSIKIKIVKILMHLKHSKKRKNQKKRKLTKDVKTKLDDSLKTKR